MENEQDKNIWEEFGVSETQWDALADELESMEEGAEDLVEYCKAAFAGDAEKQVKAFIIAMDYAQWQAEQELDDDDEEEEENETDDELLGQ